MRDKLLTEVIFTPRQQTGPVKFGIEHDIRPDNGKKELTSQELRKKAKHYQDNSDR